MALSLFLSALLFFPPPPFSSLPLFSELRGVVSLPLCVAFLPLPLFFFPHLLSFSFLTFVFPPLFQLLFSAALPVFVLLRFFSFPLFAVSPPLFSPSFPAHELSPLLFSFLPLPWLFPL